jgi:hypothetical protein
MSAGDGRLFANYSNAVASEFKAKLVGTSAPLAIEPRKVSRTAAVYAVFAID